MNPTTCFLFISAYVYANLYCALETEKAPKKKKKGKRKEEEVRWVVMGWERFEAR